MVSSHYTPQIVLAVSWPFFFIDILLLSLRIWVRKVYLKERLLISDRLIMVAMTFGLGGQAVCTWLMAQKLQSDGATTEFGVVLALGMERAETYLKFSFAATWLYYLSIYTTKAAFLAFYYQLYEQLTKQMKIMLHCVAGFTATTFIINLVLNGVLCDPIETNWSLNPSEQCSATITLSGFATATFTNVTTDILLMIIPIFIIRTINLAKREIFGLIFVVVVGSLAIVSCIIRFVLLYAISNSLNYTDISIDAFILWTLIDICAALAAACLPAFRVFLRAKPIKVAKKLSAERPSYPSSGTGRSTENGSIPEMAEWRDDNDGLPEMAEWVDTNDTRV